jgi:hypothetical protein
VKFSGCIDENRARDNLTDAGAQQPNRFLSTPPRNETIPAFHSRSRVVVVVSGFAFTNSRPTPEL